MKQHDRVRVLRVPLDSEYWEKPTRRAARKCLAELMLNREATIWQMLDDGATVALKFYEDPWHFPHLYYLPVDCVEPV